MCTSCISLCVRFIFRLVWNIVCNLIAFCVSLPFTVLLIFLLTAHLIFKWIVLFICGGNKNSIFYGAGRKMLGSGDLGWAEIREEYVMQAALVFDCKVDVHRIRELVNNRVIPLYPRLKHRICALPYTANSVYCWLPDKHFSINKHVYADQTVVTSSAQLQHYMSKQMYEKLPLDKPPWELRILSCQDGNPFSDTIIILRVHQSLADAMTLIKILCTRLSDTRTSYTAIKDHYKFRYYVRIIQVCCIGPAIILYRLAISSLNKFWLKVEKTKSCSIHWSSNICLYKVDRIKQVTRTSYNCVMLTAVSGAFRHLLQRNGIKHPPDLKLVLPVSIDKNQRYLPAAFNIPVSMEGAIPRLWKMKYDLRLLFKSYNPFISFFIFYILIPLCPSKFRPMLNNISKKSASIQYSSITGPSSRLVIDGSPLKTIYTFLPSKNDLGVSISVITYADQVSVSVVTNSSLGNAGRILVKYIEEQVDQMFVLLMNRTVPADDANSDYYSNYLPDVSHVTSKELKSRMQVIQYELQQLNELIKYSEDDMKHFNRLKSEFQHALKEVKRRKSEKRKRSRCSGLIKGIVKTQTMCSLRGRKIILYSLPHGFHFNTDQSAVQDVVSPSNECRNFTGQHYFPTDIVVRNTILRIANAPQSNGDEDKKHSNDTRTYCLMNRYIANDFQRTSESIDCFEKQQLNEGGTINSFGSLPVNFEQRIPTLSQLELSDEHII